MGKDIKYGKEAREELASGIKALANTVGVTMGARGSNVMYSDARGNPSVSKDGVTVAKQFAISDKFKSLGVNMVKKVSAKTALVAGDGTTTATILANEIVELGVKTLEDSKVNPIRLKNGLDKALGIFVERLDKLATPISTESDISDVAYISSNGDEEIAKLITEAIVTVGDDGVVTVDKSNTNKSYIDVVEGYSFGRGLASAEFATNRQNGTFDRQDMFIVCVDKSLGSVQEIEPILSLAHTKGVPLALIATDFSEQVADVITQNVMKGVLQILPIKAPFIGKEAQRALLDIAVMTGATVITQHTNIAEFTEEWCGFAEKVKVTKSETFIMGGHSDKDTLDEYVLGLRALVDDATTSEYDKDKHRERISKLSGGIARICVGAETEIEMAEKTERYDDALSATRSALDEGIIAGGGTALVAIGQGINIDDFSGDYSIAMSLLIKAVEAPFDRITTNAHIFTEASAFLKTDEFVYGKGYDVDSLEIVDMLEKGIIDPVKVTKTALKNAVSIASMVLTTNCIMVDDDDSAMMNALS